MNATYLAAIEVIAIVITAIAVVAILWSTKHPEEGDSHALAKYEKYWVVLILIIFIAFSVSTIGFLPYPYAHSNITPYETVDVQAQQFSWCLTNSSVWGPPYCAPIAYKIPVNEYILFDVRSIDVTHGFGVYSPQGAILFQVQVMPNFTNSIMYEFHSTGTYYIRCLEFCGYGHYGMISMLNVSSS